MTDWDMVVESWAGRPSQLSEVHAEESTNRAEPRSRRRCGPCWRRAGQFTYDDHGTPWSTRRPQPDRPALSQRRDERLPRPRAFSNGTVQIQSYQPFRTDMQSRFTLDGGKVHFDRIDLVSDGAERSRPATSTSAAGPSSSISSGRGSIFRRRRTSSFTGRSSTSRAGDFTGTFHLFKGGRELKGTFVSPLAGVNDWRFPNLRGSVLWVPDRLEITNATSELYGGTARFDYRMAPFGKPTPARATWDVEYTDVDLASSPIFSRPRGCGSPAARRAATVSSGRSASGRRRRGEGEVTVDAAAGCAPMTRELPADLVAERARSADEAGPFNPQLSLGYLPIAGHVVYALDPGVDSRSAELGGDQPRPTSSSRGGPRSASSSRIPFHVTSLDWQESDRVLAGIMTAFGSPTGAVPIGGYGEFDGVLLEAFTAPADRGHVHRRADARLGRRLGHRPRRARDREQLRLRDRTRR